MPELRLLGAKKLPAGRRVEEEIPYRDRRAGRVGGGSGVAHPGRTGRFHGPAALLARASRHQREPRYGSDARQCLASKAHAPDLPQIFEAPDLAGGMATQREHQIVAMNAGAVVPHPNELRAAAFHLHLSPAPAGIDAVLEQFLQHRGGTLDHLARRDLVGEGGVQTPDSHGGKLPAGAARCDPEPRIRDPQPVNRARCGRTEPGGGPGVARCRARTSAFSRPRAPGSIRVGPRPR